MTKLTCKSLTKSYANNRVLNDVSADIAKGELVTLLGPSGCGKTTLLRAIAGLSMADTGSILLDGADITHTPIHRRNIGMVFQSHALFPHMSVTDNVAFGLRMQGIQVDERRNRVGDALALVRLNGFENRMPHELSGGQQQRVAIARAIAINPSVLLLDEPFGALDRKLRETLQVELRQLTKNLSMTAIFVTHDQEEALVLSDRIAVMNGGVIQQIGSPAEVFERPANQFVADFMGFENMFPATVVSQSNGTVRLTSRGLQVEAINDCNAVSGEVKIGLRSERIKFSDGSGTDADWANRLPGKVTTASYRGDRWVYAVDTSVGVFSVKGSADAKAKGVGQPVLLSWERAAVRVFGS